MNRRKNHGNVGRSDERYARKARGSSRGRTTPPESTGSEGAYLRSLVDSGRMVTVVLQNGDRLRGRVRYFDRDCLSIGLADRDMNVLLRKSGVLFLSED